MDDKTMSLEDFIYSNNKKQIIENHLDKNQKLMRLFAVACCHLIWQHLNNTEKEAVNTAELFCDNLVTKDDLIKACRSVYHIDYYGNPAYTVCSFEDAAFSAFYTSAYIFGKTAKSNVDLKGCYANQFIILKNMKGNWQDNWNTKDVNDLATTIYNNKSYSLMPILTDALIEAGCNDESILEYCTQPNFYFRGCWVLDKATGKR